MNDDSISRQAVLDKFEPWLKVKDYNDGELNMLKAILYEIRFMPPATDKNVGAKHGTNLAEVGTDCISRQQAIGALRNYLVGKNVPCDGTLTCRLIENEVINKLPSAQLIRCCECKYLQCNMRPDGYLPKGVDEFECRHWCGSCDPMDFCSQAVRREVTT